MNYDVAIVGAGYVGVPLAQTFADAGQRVLLLDVVPDVVAAINRGESHIEDVPSEPLEPHVTAGRITATTDYEQLKQAAAILIALPTPLTKQREPDLSYVEQASHAIGQVLQPGQVVVLESTTYPGTTREVVQPILEEGSGLKAGKDFHLAMSPERVDPGRTDWTTKTTPKVVGGLNAAWTAAAAAVYGGAVDTVHTVSTPEAAELTKLLENIFRSVNIALVNELAQLCDRMDIDVWEVVDAAATKPFGFMSFQPGPGLGGHCIPLDPYYLSWKAREYDFSTRFIELAGEVNNNMPYFCRSVISQALNHGLQKSVSGSQILILGVAYKADIGDMRETPAEKLIELLRTAGADVAYHDPHVPEFDGMTSSRSSPRPTTASRSSPPTRRSTTRDIVSRAKVVVDFRNATRAGRERQGLEALDVRVGQVGLGAWGANLVRNLDDLADLTWICDASEERRDHFARRFPNARATTRFDELLADPQLEAVVIATPVPTHYALAKQALEAGKHVFVEKPPAMRAAEMEELVAARRGARPRADARPPAALPPGRAQAEGARRLGRPRRGALHLRQPPEPRHDPQGRERALVARRPRPLGDPLPVDEEPSEAWAHGNAFLTPGVEDVVFCYLRFPSGKIAHLHLSWLDPHKMRKLTVVGRDKMAVFDDMELERKVTIYEKAPEQPAQSYGEWQTRTGDIFSPKIPNDEPLRLELPHFLRLVREGGDGTEARDGLAVVRALEQLPESLRG